MFGGSKGPLSPDLFAIEVNVVSCSSGSERCVRAVGRIGWSASRRTATASSSQPAVPPADTKRGAAARLSWVQLDVVPIDDRTSLGWPLPACATELSRSRRPARGFAWDATSPCSRYENAKRVGRIQ
jgi:hypothetical protein